MSAITIMSYDENETIMRQERMTYEYGADGIRGYVMHEIAADGGGVLDLKTRTLPAVSLDTERFYIKRTVRKWEYRTDRKPHYRTWADKPDYRYKWHRRGALFHV